MGQSATLAEFRVLHVDLIGGDFLEGGQDPGHGRTLEQLGEVLVETQPVLGRDRVQVGLRARRASARSTAELILVRSHSGWCRFCREPRSTWAIAGSPAPRSTSIRIAISTPYPVRNGVRSSRSREAANSPASGWTNPVSSGKKKFSRGLAVSSVTRPPPSATDCPAPDCSVLVNGRR